MANALIDCSFRSETLGMQSEIRVLLPHGEAPSDGWPTLWLFHGRSDDHTAWTRKTRLEHYVNDLGLAVVMPNAHRSFYTNMAHGLPYFDFVSQELPSICRRLFPLSSERRNNFTAGLSMGGYGALKVALAAPQQYAATASLSGALHISGLERIQEQPNILAEMENIFGRLDMLEGSRHDLAHLAKQAAASEIGAPRIFQCCGLQDELYQSNLHFKASIADLPGIELTYREGPGDHDWDYWDAMIQDVLRWLPLPQED